MNGPKARARYHRCDICGDSFPEAKLRNEGTKDHPKWVCRDDYRCWGGYPLDERTTP